MSVLHSVCGLHSAQKHGVRKTLAQSLLSPVVWLPASTLSDTCLGLATQNWQNQIISMCKVERKQSRKKESKRPRQAFHQREGMS